MPQLLIKKLGKSYPTRRVLRGLSLTLESGIVALLGPNGAGKSTALNILSTQLTPTAGYFQLGEWRSDEEPMEIRQRIGMVGHQSFLYRDLTLDENLDFYSKLYKVSQNTERKAALVERFQLKDRLDQRVGEYSRGLLQRASLVRALLHDPDVLLLDEPFTGLDQTSSKLLLGLLDEWHSSSKLLLLTTHDLAHAAQCSNRAVILRNGKLAADVEGPFTLDSLRSAYDEAVRS